MTSHYVTEVLIDTTANGIPVLGGCYNALQNDYRTDDHFPRNYPKKTMLAYKRPNWYFDREKDGFVYYRGSMAPFRWKYRVVRREPHDIVVIEFVDNSDE
ncbi:MAG: hypothetical protein AAB442_00915 [Patescibacteria group bacterium]